MEGVGMYEYMILRSLTHSLCCVRRCAFYGQGLRVCKSIGRPPISFEVLTTGWPLPSRCAHLPFHSA